MHDVLRIPELLFRVFEFLRSRELYRCSLACRLFATVGLEILWRRPVPLEAILGLFPLWAIDWRNPSRFKADGPSFRPSSWQRLLEQAPRITGLYYYQHSSYKHRDEWDRLAEWPIHLLHQGEMEQQHLRPRLEIPNNLFSLLGIHRPRFHILPGLRSLEWVADDPSSCILFLSESIEKLSLSSHVFTEAMFEELSARLAVEKLRSLRLQTTSGGLDIRNTTKATFFRRLSGLEDLTVGREIIDGDTLYAISQLPSLVNLQIVGRLFEGVLPVFHDIAQAQTPESVPTAQDSQQRTYNPTKSFTMLRHLEFSLNPVHEYFFSDPRFISSPNLSSLNIAFNGNDAASIRELFKSIASRFPALKRLHFRAHDAFYDFIVADTKMQDVYQKPQRVARIRRSLFTIDTLRPLFDLHDLEEFVLEWPYAVKLDEGGIQEMVASWPNLVVLYLTPVPFFILPERPSIHLESLRLLSPLRRLKKLAVFVDAVDPLSLGTVRPTNDDAGINPNCSLREFDPGRSWISKWQYAANMLVSMFPNVRFPDVERRDTIWGDVARVVRDQRSTRGVL